MNLSNKIARVVSSFRHPGVWLGLAAVLAGPLFLSSFALQGDETSRTPDEPSPANVQMIFRAPEEPTVGERFTLEVLLLNTGTAPVKNLEFHAQLDANLEQPSKARDFRAAVETIAPDDLQIVRLTVTPRKSGPGGVDVTLRNKNGVTQQLRHVLPISPEYPSLPAKERAQGASPLQFKFSPLKACFADRPGIVLISVLNTDSKPMPSKLELVVSYATMGHDNHIVDTPISGEPAVKHGRIPHMQVASSNPTRQVQVSLPALEPGETHTLPVRLTPRRIGELGIAVTAKGDSNPLGAGRLQVRFDPDTPIERLLPVRAGASVPARLPQTLAEVTEVALEEPHAKKMAADEAFEHVSHLIEKINHANKTKMDGYMEALASHRSDMRGMPFTLGNACRLAGDRAQHFQAELSRLRVAMSNPAAMASQLPNPTAQPEGEAAIKARIAALIQVVEPESPELVRQMVKYLAAISHVDATRILAKLAICAEDDQVRNDAVAALAVRRDKDFSDILRNGLEYPWPAVAQRTTEAIVKLKHMDLAPELAAMLDRPDPRAPQIEEKNGKQVTVVQELVRINHLRNCLLCHSPARPGAVPSARDGTLVENLGRGGPDMVAMGGLTAPVPLPNQPVPTPTPHGGYGHFTIPDTQLAFDMTYLRQDFSVKMRVANAQPWPEMQRFDFLVRTRELSEQDAQAYRDLFRPAKAGELSPYQQAAVTALRQLTGRNAEPTAAAWRQVLADIKDSQ